jgi:hypothetical protein
VVDLDPGLIAVFAIAAFFLIWYYGAFIYSRRLAARVARELKDAVLALGGTSQIRWFGTGAFRMTTEGATEPFREFSVTVTLRPREMPINWAIAKAQRRQDAALVEASLRKEPKVTFELVDPTTRIGQRRKRAQAVWSPVTIAGRNWLLAADDEDRVRRLLESLGPEDLTTIMAPQSGRSGTAWSANGSAPAPAAAGVPRGFRPVPCA